MYSCAFYESEEDSLETAQFQKLDRICRKLRLGRRSCARNRYRLGAFALHPPALRLPGNDTTISRQQFDVAEQRFEGTNIELLQEIIAT